MVRGLIFGILWGGIFTALFLSVVSLLAPMPDEMPMSDGMSIETTMAPEMPAAEPTPTPDMPAPVMDDAPELGETTAAIAPEAGEAANALNGNVQADEMAAMPETVDQPSLSSIQSTAPEMPSVEIEPTVEAAPADAMEQAMEDAPKPAVNDDNTMVTDAPLESDDSVVTNRLPTVSNSAADESYAIGDDRPMMSIVLIDNGSFNIGPEALASFPYPISFAIDPFTEDALDKAALYQDRGFEVLVTADLPETGGRELAELALLPTLNSIPGVVGVLEGTDTGLQGNMELSEGVLALVADSDYGLVLRPKGLNAAQQMAEGRNLPVETVFRDFDGNDQTATVIRRFLDQAAFRARQEGAVIMVGRLRPATISALLLWGLQDRAASVALVPISDVLER